MWRQSGVAKWGWHGAVNAYKGNSELPNGNLPQDHCLWCSSPEAEPETETQVHVMIEGGSRERGSERNQTGQETRAQQGCGLCWTSFSLIPRGALECELHHRAGPNTGKVLVSVSHRLCASLMWGKEDENSISSWARLRSCMSPEKGTAGNISG